MKIRFFKRLEFWSALLLIPFFFLPWASLNARPPLNGLQLADTMRQAGSLASGFSTPAPSFGAFDRNLPPPPDTSLIALTAILIYLIPIAALLSILIDPITHNSRPGILYFFTSLLPFIVLAIALSKIGPDLFKSLTLGSYLTLAAAALIFLSLFRSPLAPNSRANKSTPPPS